MEFVRSRAGGLRILHRPEFAPEHVLRAIEAHRRNAARGREFCEHWGPASSVSRILVRREAGDLDLAVKWNHARGARAAVAEWLRGSRADRAVRGAERLRGLGIAHPDSGRGGRAAAAGARRRELPDHALLAGSRAAARADAAAARRAAAPARGGVRDRAHDRRAARGRPRPRRSQALQPALITADDRVALLDLDSLVPPRRPTLAAPRARARASSRRTRATSIPIFRAAIARAC